MPTPLFQQLKTSWKFTPAPSQRQQTRIDFSVEYAFANPMYGMLARGAMDTMARQMVGAFEQRAAIASAEAKAKTKATAEAE